MLGLVIFFGLCKVPKACLSTISIITILSTLFLTACLLSLSSKGNEANDASARGGYFHLCSNYMQNNLGCKLMEESKIYDYFNP